MFFGLGLIFIALANGPMGYNKDFTHRVNCSDLEGVTALQMSKAGHEVMMHAGGEETPTLTRSSKPLNVGAPEISTVCQYL